MAGRVARRLCFVGLRSFDYLIANERPRYIGGAELQQALLAQAMAALGYDVTLVTLDDGQRDGDMYKGVAVQTAYRRQAGLPMVRFVHPRWAGLCAALRRADADTYIQMCAEGETGQTALWCVMHRRQFVFQVASDANCLRPDPSLRKLWERLLYEWGLRLANVVVAESHHQQRLLWNNYHRRSVVISGFSRDPGSGPRFEPVQPTLLWVGRWVDTKHPELTLELARALPEFLIDVVGPAAASSPTLAEFACAARAVPNLRLRGVLSAAELDAAYRAATALISTSELEGYPVTFIESWSRSVPTISFFDPDGVIARHKLGFRVATLREMADAARLLSRDPELRQACGAAARRFYEEHHTLAVCAAAYDQIFKSNRSEHRVVKEPAFNPDR